MDESVFYTPSTATDAAELSFLASIRSNKSHVQFRQCAANAASITGTGQGHRLFVACPEKALIQVYLWGKESPEQKMAVPEELTSLLWVHIFGAGFLVGGGKSGRLYVWELASGYLLSAKEAHYQEVSCLEVSHDGQVLVSGGKDSRVLIWRLADLIQFSSDPLPKPIHVLTNHSLPITSIALTKGISNDIKLFTSSLDGEVRHYNVSNGELLTTFIFGEPVNALAVDPAQRYLYAGLSSGTIRLVPLFIVNHKNQLESNTGCGKLVSATSADDPESQFIITSHQDSPVTCLQVSADGGLLVSADSAGKVFVNDIVSRQVARQLRDCSGPISTLRLLINDLERVEPSDLSTKASTPRILPNLKRSLISDTEISKHDINIPAAGTPEGDIGSLASDNEQLKEQFDLRGFLNQVRKEHVVYQLNTEEEAAVDQSVQQQQQDTDENVSTQQYASQLKEMTKAYNELKRVHQDLYSEHLKLLDRD
ncbi:Rix1 complex component [Komagataella phaffii CBS 7435]|uniref:Pre-rRNA-processing protein IPI3 n=1 Tax=Komagataella phaffii (strain ATCC 76273 / CBS 7435 / CECT 11047 / NRRL Y-11430 / Wegner 21-1) TaxID=981350 RepID=F2QLZ1_KOMPC|nr:GQ67_02366T0 [Komagataella phaffii]AOA65894.1 GQ68_02881T0 [Komagataella phaffii GS115]CAH2445824.1 Rix1 complex component [Komagataella phaffii CBS 7435]CCA36279.1 Rix1 complex component [Komagataella phaffii CBS 7435]